MFIPYGKQYIDDDDIDAVIDVLRSDYLTTGPKVAEFEKSVAEYIGVKYAVAISNGTAALHAACYAAGISEGDEVITSPMTFAASANCVLYCGGIPVFADIDRKNYNIDPNEIRKKITNKTKAIIAVHYTGQPCDMDEIHKIADDFGLIVIEDAAHALGASYKGKRVGSLSDMTTFSFHPVKHITTGEGGMITTNNKELYDRLVMFRSHGITRNRDELNSYEGEWYYEQQELGYNYRITDIQSALGISQMNKLDSFLERRRVLAENYTKAFYGMKDIITPSQLDDRINSWHLYVIQVKNQNREVIFQKLRDEGVGVNVHYIPVYKHPYYQKLGYNHTICPNAEQVYNNIISLPLYASLSDDEQAYVINTIKSILC